MNKKPAANIKPEVSDAESEKEDPDKSSNTNTQNFRICLCCLVCVTEVCLIGVGKLCVWYDYRSVSCCVCVNRGCVLISSGLLIKLMCANQFRMCLASCGFVLRFCRILNRTTMGPTRSPSRTRPSTGARSESSQKSSNSCQQVSRIA